MEKKIKKFARDLRKNLTSQERRIWYYLRDRRFLDHKFRRQVPVGYYIVDFLCKEKKLIIEVDGGHHNESPEKLKDDRRDKYLESKGFTVLRFWNHEVNQDIDAVFEKIFHYLK